MVKTTSAKSEDVAEQASGLGMQASASEGEDLDNASPSSSDEKPDKKNKGEGRDPKEFYANVVINPKDIGKTLLELMNDAQEGMDPRTELSETEEQYLNDMLFKGFVVHEMFIKKGFPVQFRSISPAALRRGYDMLGKEKGVSAKLGNVAATMVTACYLNLYGVTESDIKYLKGPGLDQEQFESKEEIEARYKFCSSLPTVILDVISKRANDFMSLLERVATVQNITNFSKAP